MKIIDILKQKKKGIAFEFFPPKTETGSRALLATVAALRKYKPLYASMTYGAGGLTQDKTKEAVYMLAENKDLVVMPHMTCIGAESTTLKSLLDEYEDAGIENIMALRGDIPQEGDDFNFSDQEFCYAQDLVKYVKKYGNFCIGVAVYPEGHIETSSLDEDLEYTKQKIDAGASFGVTQMFFDNNYYYDFLGRMEKKGINIPVLPGILPLTNLDKVRQFASICRTTIPKKVEEKMGRFEGKSKDMQKAGIELTIEQCQDLLDNGIGRLHFFTLNKPEVMTQILDALVL